MTFSFDTFNNLIRTKGVDRAIEYRDSFKKELLKETKEVSRDDMKALLTEKGIEFPKNIKTDKLVELCIENNLL